jgi:hypothetical protein
MKINESQFKLKNKRKTFKKVIGQIGQIESKKKRKKKQLKNKTYIKNYERKYKKNYWTALK